MEYKLTSSSLVNFLPHIDGGRNSRPTAALPYLPLYTLTLDLVELKRVSDHVDNLRL